MNVDNPYFTCSPSGGATSPVISAAFRRWVLSTCQPSSGDTVFASQALKPTVPARHQPPGISRSWEGRRGFKGRQTSHLHKKHQCKKWKCPGQKTRPRAARSTLRRAGQPVRTASQRYRAANPHRLCNQGQIRFAPSAIAPAVVHLREMCDDYMIAAVTAEPHSPLWLGGCRMCFSRWLAQNSHRTASPTILPFCVFSHVSSGSDRGRVGCHRCMPHSFDRSHQNTLCWSSSVGWPVFCRLYSYGVFQKEHFWIYHNKVKNMFL